MCQPTHIPLRSTWTRDRGEWNGDADLSDGTLAISRKQCDDRVKSGIALSDKEQDKKSLIGRLMACVSNLSDDVVFLTRNSPLL